jgi:hypothetical protein
LNPTDPPSSPATGRPERSKATSRTIWLSLGGIALVGGIASYGRTLGVIQAVDGKSVLAWFEAALADPTIAAASVNIVDARRQGSKLPKFSLVSILVAAVVTLGANVVYGQPHPVPKPLVNVWPPVAFLLAFESLMSFVRRGHTVAAAPVPAAESHEDQCPHGVAASVEDAVRLAYEHGRDCEGVTPKFVDLAASFRIDRKRVAELVKGPSPALPVPGLNGTPVVLSGGVP